MIEPQRDIFEELIHETINEISEEDMTIIYEILAKSTNTDTPWISHENDNEKLFTIIVSKIMTAKLKLWVREVFGDAVFDYLMNCDPDEQERRLNIFQESEFIKLIKNYEDFPL